MNRLQVEQREKSLVARCIFINIEWIGKNIASSQILYPHPKPDVGNLDRISNCPAIYYYIVTRINCPIM